MANLFHTFLYVPIYNLLIGIVDILPHGDIGVAVILVTLAVNVLILPLSLGAVRTQQAMKTMEPELNEIKKRLKDDKEAQAREMFELYKKHKINPFASIGTLLVQLPILLALYWVFNNHALLTIDSTLLYSFVGVPDTVSPLFLGLLPVMGHSIILAVVAGLAQLAQALYAVPVPPKPAPDSTPNMQADMSRALALQMRYVFPILMAGIAYTSGAIALYLITRTCVLLLQEYIVRHEKRKKSETEALAVI